MEHLGLADDLCSLAVFALAVQKNSCTMYFYESAPISRWYGFLGFAFFKSTRLPSGGDYVEVHQLSYRNHSNQPSLAHDIHAGF